MLKQVMVEIEEDEVVAASLTDTLWYIEESIARYVDPSSIKGSLSCSAHIFSNDPEEDLKKLKKFRKALKKVIDWYSPPNGEVW